MKLGIVFVFKKGVKVELREVSIIYKVSQSVKSLQRMVQRDHVQMETCENLSF